MRSLRRIWIAVLTVALSLVAIVAWRFSSDLTQARQRASRDGTIIETTRGPIEYAERGSGRTALSIHGAAGGHDQGLATALDLFGPSVRIVAPSRFGYLGTPVPALPSDAAQADAHAALLDRLSIDAVVVFGVSAGARSALEFAVRHPDRTLSLVLLVPGTYSPNANANADATTVAGRPGPTVTRIIEIGGDFVWWALEKLHPSLLARIVGVPSDVFAVATSADREKTRELVRGVLPFSRRFVGLTLDADPHLHDLPLVAVRVPTLIMTARDDLYRTIGPAEYAASRIAGSRLVVHETGGHLLLGHDAEVKAEVARFMASLSK